MACQAAGEDDNGEGAALTGLAFGLGFAAGAPTPVGAEDNQPGTSGAGGGSPRARRPDTFTL